MPELDITVSVLSCEDLSIPKLVAGRIIDRFDVVALLGANQESLDTAYLEKWVRQLALEPEWTKVWAEAFPGKGGQGELLS
jgi:hypothetical protein